MTRQQLVLRYGFFALVATFVNLAGQRFVMAFGNSTYHFFAAVFFGTLVGLVAKYVLDKRWIFYDHSAGVKANGQKFALYTIMGIITTVIFWGAEATFWFVWSTDLMREIGAVIGLAIGYVVKYNLDRKFVFTRSELTPSKRG